MLLDVLHLPSWCDAANHNIVWHTFYLVLTPMKIFSDFFLSEIFQGCKNHHLGEGHKLAKYKPEVNHFDGRGGRKTFHLADENCRHDQHSCQIHTQSCFKEEWFEEGGSKGDHHEEK